MRDGGTWGKWLAIWAPVAVQRITTGINDRQGIIQIYPNSVEHEAVAVAATERSTLRLGYELPKHQESRYPR